MPATPDPTRDAPAAQADASHRYVLGETSPYIANLAALWAADPKLAAAIEALEDAPSHATEPSKSGSPTVSLRTEQGRTISLHSRYEPLDEAKRLIEPLPTDDRTAYYIHGFGLGYHVQELFDRASSEAIICVLESDLVLLRTALELRDFTKLIHSGRVLFFWQADKSELFMRLTPHTATISTGFEAVTHAPSLQVQPEFHRQMQTWIGEFISFCRTNISTLVLNGRRTAENVSRNIAWYAAAPSIARLQNAYRGSPAVIVSAGPSLRKNKHLLPSVVGKVCVIAVQTMLQPLLEMGVEPQFVTSLDYHDICTRFFENLPKHLRTELVAEPKATSAIFDLNPGPLSLLGNDFADQLLAELKLNKARLPSGATVAHLAYYLAEYLGCDPIIFIGQDLGFSDGLCYSPGTSYEDVWRPELSRFCTVETKQWEQIVRDRNILRRTTDHAGRAIYTEERLFTYLQQFERDFARSSARIIDATEGGVLKRGATSMAFAEAIKQFCTRPVPEAPPPHPGLTWDRLDDCAASLKQRREEASQIEQVSRETLPLLQEVRDHLDDQPRVNRAIGRIDVLRARMADLGGCYNLIMQLTQATELRRFKADRKIEASRASGTDKQRRQVERDIENVRSVIDASIEFRDLIAQVVAGFEHFAPEIRAAQKARAAA
jgi:hypothetical protein